MDSSEIESKALNHLEELSYNPKQFAREKLGNPQIPSVYHSLQHLFMQKLQNKGWKWWLNKLLPPIFMDIYRVVRDKGNAFKKFLFKILTHKPLFSSVTILFLIRPAIRTARLFVADSRDL